MTVSVLDRYIRHELLKTLAGVAVVLYLIFLSNKLVRYLADVADGELPGSYLLIILVLISIRYLIILTPLALFISLLLMFGRLYRDHEMASLFACGVGTGRLYRPVFQVTVPLAILIAFLSLYAVPWVAQVEVNLQKELLRNLEFTGISPGKFHISGKRIVYLESLSDDNTRMENVFIQTQYKGRDIVMVAEKAHLEVTADTGQRILVLNNGSRYEGIPGEADFRQLNFSRHSLLVAPSKSVSLPTTAEAQTTLDLFRENTLESNAELQWRIAIPLSMLLLAFLAVPLSRAKPRQGQFGRLFIGILIYVIYVNLIAVSKAWIVAGKLDPVVGMTWVHILMLLLTLVILTRQHGWRWTLEQWRPLRRKPS